MALYTPDSQNGEGLVWASEVHIEIDPDVSKHSSISHTYLDSGQIVPDCDSIPKQPYHFRDTETHFSTGDADDEGSIHMLMPSTDLRGRPRSRTKQLRRRGIDLSRDELRISSRWSRREKQSMEDFRRAIREKASGEMDDPFFARWMGGRDQPAAEEAKSVTSPARSMKKLVRKLGSSVSRSRHNRNQRDLLNGLTVASTADITNPGLQTVPMERGHQDYSYTLRQVQSSASIQLKLDPDLEDWPREIEMKGPCPTIVGTPSTIKSWQEHLVDDLQPNTNRQLRHKKAKYLLQEHRADVGAGEFDQDCGMLTSNFGVEYAAPVCHESPAGFAAQCSRAWSDFSHHHVDTYWRLPSLAHSALDRVCKSRDSSSPCGPEKLNDVISSGNFETAWWKTTSRSRQTSANYFIPTTTIHSGCTSDSSPDYIEEYVSSTRSIDLPTAELIATLRARLAENSIRQDDLSIRPLLQPSTRVVNENLKQERTSCDIIGRPFE